MLKTKRLVCLICIDIFIAACFLILCFFLIPAQAPLFAIAVGFVVFFVCQVTGESVFKGCEEKLERTCLQTGSTSLMYEFIQKLRCCYSLEDLFGTIGKILEMRGDCSVLFVNTEKNYIIYNSPNQITCSQYTLDLLRMNLAEIGVDGAYFFDESFSLVSEHRNSRGFFLVCGNHHFYVFCKYTFLFDKSIFGDLYNEYVWFLTRTNIISQLDEITELSHEWRLLADVQQAFLPPFMPEVPKVSLASYFRPLVHVSGDYYTVLPLDERKTLVMLGDVSGKGLAAALVMGLVVNTVKVMEDKENLEGIVRSIDMAIKSMRFQDKYTVLFIGIIDTDRMTIRYINASMSDPLVLTRSPDGYRVKTLASNCPIVGIIDLDNISIVEQKLFKGDVLLMVSDGVSEAMDRNGNELSSTDLYLDTIREGAGKQVEELVDDIATLVLSYSNERLRDDVTILAAKIEG